MCVCVCVDALRLGFARIFCVWDLFLCGGISRGSHTFFRDGVCKQNQHASTSPPTLSQTYIAGMLLLMDIELVHSSILFFVRGNV
jgi:hypothetical protein